MNKAAILVLTLALIVSVSGCISKGEYDKMFNDKLSLEKEHAKLIQENTRLRGESDMLKRVKQDLANITLENTRLKDDSNKLLKEKTSIEEQLKQTTAKINDLSSQLNSTETVAAKPAVEAVKQ